MPVTQKTSSAGRTLAAAGATTAAVSPDPAVSNVLWAHHEYGVSGNWRTWVAQLVLPRGDLNCDGLIDFGDINPFVLALTNPAGYAAAYPGCPLANRDINGDGVVRFRRHQPVCRAADRPVAARARGPIRGGRRLVGRRSRRAGRVRSGGRDLPRWLEFVPARVPWARGSAGAGRQCLVENVYFATQT